MSLGDDEFGVPEDPIEQERFKRRLIATARSLKKKHQRPQADKNLPTDRRTKARAAVEYGLERQTKYYPKRRLLPQFEEAALKIKRRPTPLQQHTAARGCAQDQHYIPNSNIASTPDASADKNRVYKPWRNKYKRPKATNGA